MEMSEREENLRDALRDEANVDFGCRGCAGIVITDARSMHCVACGRTLPYSSEPQ